jgi:phosphate transport system protein
MSVCSRVLQMASSVETQLRVALETLATGDHAAIAEVIAAGDMVNSLEIEIDESCTDILVRRQPTANDLRLVSAVIKTINDLERIGDESENIAHVSQHFANKPSANMPCRHQINYVAEIALGMLKDAIHAFDAMNPDAARKIGHRDALIEEEFRAIMRHLVAYMMEDASELTTTLQIIFVVKAIERIANHAKNISEYVIYMIEGRESRNYCTI